MQSAMVRALVFLVTLFVPEVSAHGAVTKPLPRRGSPWCPWCVGWGQSTGGYSNPYGTVNRDAKPSSPCRGTWRGQEAYSPQEYGEFSVVAQKGPEQYWPGQLVDTTIVLDADHGGDAQWSFCPHSEEETEACFRREDRLLTNWTDVHAYWGERSTAAHRFDNQYFPQSFRLPVDMPAGMVTLRWFWVCKFTSEIFVSCIDVDIAAGSGSAPAPARPSPASTAPPTPAPTSPPTPAPTWATPAPTWPPTFHTPAPAPVPATAPAQSPEPEPEPEPEPTEKPAIGAGACSGEWEPCGGLQHSGPACCTAGLTCKVDNAYWSFCRREAYSGPCSGAWGQCGGRGWTGPTCCAPGLQCAKAHEYYSQCLSEPALVEVRAHRPGFLARGSAP